MDNKIVLKYFAFQDQITIYWEKTYKLQDTFVYEIYLNQELHGKTKKTHNTFYDLSPETEYEVEVKVAIGEQGSQQFSGRYHISTTKLKEAIDVTKAPYDAVNDGKTINTGSLQRAIDDCKGDQYVYIPKGVFMTGSLKLHSNMELYVEEGGVLQGTQNPEDYLPMIKSRFEGYERMCYSSLLNLGDLDSAAGYHCSNCIIRGKGTIGSGGKVLAQTMIDLENERLKDYLRSLGDGIKEYEKPETIAGRIRPRLVNMSNCENIILDGIQFRNGASWNIHMVYSNNIITHNCFIYSKGIWNGDGWDPDSSTNCTIFNTTFDTHDDCIAIKSGKNPEGNEINRPCEHINIFDITIRKGHGIAMGSEMSGGINDINIWDCDLQTSIYGLEIKGTRKRGAYVKNVTVRDFVAPRVHMHSVKYNDDGIGALIPPNFSDCRFEDLCVTGQYTDYEGVLHQCDAIELIGFDEEYKVRNITFKNVTLIGKQNIAMEYCENITLENITCR